MCDASFSGNWRLQVECKVPDRVCGAGCLVTWVCKIQTEKALSTSGAEFIQFSKVLRSVVPLMGLLEKMQMMAVGMFNRQEVFEENSEA